MSPSTIEILGTALFAVAVIHTFSTKLFELFARRHPSHAGLFHLLGEVEAVFGIWAMVLVIAILLLSGRAAAVAYLEGVNFTEPMFVFAIMVVAASRPILQACRGLVEFLARVMPLRNGPAYYFVTLSVVPLIGSFITEPAAMTLAALILLERFYVQGISARLKYATLGVLFVNVSIGGTLTPFAAPPVLMVAGTWGWDLAFMLTTFGWKAAIAVVLNAGTATALFRRELSGGSNVRVPKQSVPLLVTTIHLAFLAGIVVFAHHPAVFMGLLLFFLGFTQAYKEHQSPLMLREALMVAFFLAGLVVLGGQQKWWLQPTLAGMDATTLYYGATLLTAITDNAALTYLGSLVEGVSDEFKYALVAGAVTGGGLTVIANAPNPAGFAVLQGAFTAGRINPLGLLAAALPPTLIAVLAFQVL